jgi:anti-sigma-K factor RskA
LGWQETPPRRAGLWSSLLVWRAATALAILVALTVWVVHSPTAPTAVVSKPVTTLAQSNGAPEWLASVDQDRGTILIVPVPRATDAQGRITELWIIPAGKAPLSLGAVSITRPLTVQVPADARAALSARGSVLAITLEPAAGVPHAAPSGPVIASGPLQT